MHASTGYFRTSCASDWSASLLVPLQPIRLLPGFCNLLPFPAHKLVLRHGPTYQSQQDLMW